jgi:hypothetical protein
MPQIYASLDNRQVDHQDSVVEMEGAISNHIVSILINPGSNMSYVALKLWINVICIQQNRLNQNLYN